MVVSPLFRVVRTGSGHANAVRAVVTDPEDPRFDLEKLIAKWESDSK